MNVDQTNKQEVATSIAQLRVKPEWPRFQVIPLVDAAFTRQRQLKLDTWTGETWERHDGDWKPLESLPRWPDNPAKQA